MQYSTYFLLAVHSSASSHLEYINFNFTSYFEPFFLSFNHFFTVKTMSDQRLLCSMCAKPWLSTTYKTCNDCRRKAAERRQRTRVTTSAAATSLQRPLLPAPQATVSTATTTTSAATTSILPPLLPAPQATFSTAAATTSGATTPILRPLLPAPQTTISTATSALRPLLPAPQATVSTATDCRKQRGFVPTYTLPKTDHARVRVR